MNSDHLFRSAPFGGFNKEDVLKYIEQIKGELVVYRNNTEQQVQEILKKNSELESLLNAANASIREYENRINQLTLKMDSEVVVPAIDTPASDAAEESTAVQNENEEKAPEKLKDSENNHSEKSDELKTGGFKIEDDVLLEQDGVKFSSDTIADNEVVEGDNEPELINAEPEMNVPDGFEHDYKTLEHESVSYQTEGITEDSQKQEYEEQSAVEASDEPKPSVEAEQTAHQSSADGESFSQTQLFKENFEKTEVLDNISRAKDSMRELGVILASLGLSQDTDASEKTDEKDSESLIDSKPEIEDETASKISLDNKTQQVSEDKAEKENDVKITDEYSELEAFLNFEGFESDTVDKMNDEELKKLADKYAEQ